MELLKNKLSDLSRYITPNDAIPDREIWVHKTSKLIKRSFIATHKLCEKWPLDKIVERYELCTKHAGTMPGDVKWWWLRKQELSTSKTT